MKSRFSTRIQAKFPVTITVDCHVSEGLILDLTMPGCLIESPMGIKNGAYLQLKTFLPGCTAPFSVALAGVRWTKGSRFGVEFIKMHDKAQEQLHYVMARTQPQRLVTQEGDRQGFGEAGGRNWHLETYSLAKGTRMRG